jgi:hypothetical protein
MNNFASCSFLLHRISILMYVSKKALVRICPREQSVVKAPKQCRRAPIPRHASEQHLPFKGSMHRRLLLLYW